MMDKVDSLDPIEWGVEGDDGERVLRAEHKGVLGRVTEGRVWRWQAGDDREPAMLSGRLVGELWQAQAACECAMRMLAMNTSDTRFAVVAKLLVEFSTMSDVKET